MPRLYLFDLVPKSFLPKSLLCGALVFIGPLLTRAQTGTALVQHAPSVNGTINGFVQQMAAEGVNLNSGANISGDLLVPGTPLVQLNGSPTYGGTLEGNGATAPSNFTITLNTGSTLRHVVRRTNPVTLPTVATVPSPTGTTSVTVNTTGQAITWNGLKNLTLNSNVGVVSVPVGTYGNFSANSGSGFKLGVAGATQASLYNFQNLTLNSNSTLQVVGPVIINLANGFAANSTVGAASNPAWLKLNIKTGGYTLNTGCNTYGYVLAPAGAVIVNSGTQLVGGVTSAYLTVNSNGLLKLQPQQSPNQSPVVALTAPANGTILTSPASFALSANASDPDGTITKVEFFRGTTKLGEDLTIPYSFTLTGVTAGSYSYFARATDNLGATTDSASVSVVVNNPNQPPSVALTAPADGATFTSPATITLKATSTDADGTIAHVDFYQGSIMIGQSTSAPYQVTTSTLSAGAYVFSAKSYDNLGSISTSGSVTVTVVNPNLPPTIAITAPADGTNYFDPASFTINASASDPDGSVYKVQLFQNGIKVGEDLTAPFSFAVSSLQPGTYDFVARAADNLGYSTDSAPIRITVVHVNQAPIVGLTAPADGSVFSAPATFALQANASDPNGTIAKVEFFQGSAKLGEATNAPYQFTVSSLVAGSYAFTAKATDNEGTSTTSSTANVLVNALPGVSITAPSNGAIFPAPANITLQSFAADTDGTVTKVEYFNGSIKLGESNAAPYLVNWNNVGTGTYVVTALATDNRNGTAISTPMSLHVDVPPSAVVLTSPVSNSTYEFPATITLQASATDIDGTISKMEFFAGSTKLGETSIAPFQFVWSGMASGSYALTVRATDDLGLSTTSSPVTVNINRLPLVAWVAPANDSVFTLPASISLEASASDADGLVSKVEFFEGTTKLGEALVAPYQLALGPLSAGHHSFTARATDNSGSSATTGELNVLLNTPPAVALTAPTNGAVVSGPATITLQATASDSDGTITRVEFFNGATKLGESAAAPYQFVWSDVGSGIYSVTAVATDNRGATTSSSPISVTVDLPPGSVALTAPADNATFNLPATIALQATASDSDGTVTKVEFYAGAEKIGESSSYPYQFVWSGAPAGSFALTVRATDNLGLTATSAPITVTINTPPEVSLSAPANNSVFNAPASFTLQAIASDADGSLAKVEFFDGAAKIGESLTSPYQFPVTNLAPGSHTFTARATDNSGAVTTSSSVTVSINALPTVALTSPTNGYTSLAPATLTLVASASDSDGAISRVELYSGETKLGESASAPYEFIWTSIGSGTYVVTARAFDNLGASTTSAPVTWVANNPPTIEITSPASGATFLSPATITLQAAASDPDGSITKVEFFQGSQKIGESLSAPFQFIWTAAVGGSFSISARATDDLGSSSTSTPVSITINVPPVANPQNITTLRNATVAITLTGSHSEGSPLIFKDVTSPTNGSLIGIAPDLTYVPIANFTGTDSFTFNVSDGTLDSAAATINITIEDPNRAPVSDAGPDQQIRFIPASGSRPKGRIVVNNDEWVLTGAGFDNSPYVSLFARNLADFLTGGKPGAKFLAYTNVIPGSVEFIYTGYQLANAMQEAGHTWETSNTIQMTLANLQKYDAVFLGANIVDNQVLIDYVESGGSVYLSAGSHWCSCDAEGEAALWNNFLEHFGLHYNSPYNGIGGTLPVFSDHPLFYGIQSLFFANGNSVTRLNYLDPYTQIPFVYNGQGLFGVYADVGNQAFLHGSATDDGQPNPPGALTYHWTQVSGPASATIDAPESLTTRVRFDIAGSYTFRLTANDGSRSGIDDVTIVANRAPVVYAGADQVLRDTNQVASLLGDSTDDGIPQSTQSYLWKSLSGPGVAEFTSPTTKNTSVSFPLPGIYTLEFSANDGSYTGTDTVEIRVGMQSVEPPSGMVAWWPLNSSPVDIVSGVHNFSIGTDSYVPGRVGTALSLATDGVAIAAAHPDLDLGSSADGFTIEFWVKSGASSTMVGWANGARLFLWDGNRLAGNLQESDGTNHSFDSFQWGSDVMWINGNAWSHVAVCYDRLNGVATFYQNGQLRHTWAVGSFAIASSADFRLGGGNFSGLLDEVTLYRRPLNPEEVAAIYNAEENGKSPPDNNTPPAVSAGVDFALPNGSTIGNLNGVVIDDNRPFGLPAVRWTKVEGPGEVVFGNSNAASTTVTFSAAGVYLLKLTANDNYLQPVSDVVEVRVGGGALEAPAGLTAWWPGNGEARERVHGHDVQLLNGAAYAPGKVLQGFHFDGTFDYGRVLKHSDIDIGASAAGFTIEFWINSPSSSTFLNWADGASFHLIDGNRLGGNLREAGGTDHIFDSYYTFGATNALWTYLTPWTHVAIAYDRPAGVAKFFLNGQFKYAWNIGSFALGSSGDLYFGNGNFSGMLDEVSLYNRPLNAAEVSSIYDVGANGKNPPSNNTPPTVNAGPDFGVPSASVTATLNGIVTDDNLPFGLPIIEWSVVEGPGPVTFGNSTSQVTTARFGTAGIYLLKLTATDNLTLAVSDIVEVRVEGGTRETPDGISAWWPGNGTPHEVVNGNHDVELINGASYASAQVLQCFQFNGANNSGRVLKHPDLDIGSSSAGFTIEFWTNSGSNAPMLSWSNGAYFYLVDGNRFAGNLRESDGTNHSFDSYAWGPDVMWMGAGNWNHVAVSYDQPTGIVRFYQNGKLRHSWNVGSFAVATGEDFYLGGGTFTGLLDEISLYKRPLSSGEISSIFSAGAYGKSPPDNNAPPTVDAGADIALPSTGSSATLRGFVSDDNRPFGAPTIKWSKVEGPGEVVFGDPQAIVTTANFSAPGIYLLKLTATDNYLIPVSDFVDVRVGDVFSPLFAGISAWWPANGEPHEIINGNHDIELMYGASYATGKVSQAFTFNGEKDFGRVAKHADLDIGSSPDGFTIEYWMNAGSRASILSWSNGAYLNMIDGNRLGGNLRSADGIDHPFDSYQWGTGVMWISAGTWNHVAISYDKTAGVARFYQNGQLKYAWSIGSFALATGADFYLGDGLFAGALDEISLYKRPLDAAEIAALFNSDGFGKMRPQVNQPPVINAGLDKSALANAPLTLTGSATDDGLPNPPAVLSYLWSVLSSPVGSGPVAFGTPTALSTSVSFSTAGTYTLRLSASDSVLSATDDVLVTVTSQPPTVTISAPATNATVLANAPLSIVATATDADGTITKVEFFDGAAKLGERTTPDTSGGNLFTFTRSAGFPVGAHSLTVKVTDNDGLVTTSIPVAITCSSLPPVPPTISIFEPLPGPSVLIENYFEIAATAVDSDGTIAKVEFFQGGTKLGEQIFSELGHPTTYFWPMFGGLPAGTYTFTAKATDNSGLSTTSAPVTVEVTATPSSASSVYIATPDDDTRVSAPTPITGLIVPPALTSWSLQYRLRPAGDDTSASPDPWLVAATGTAAIGTAATADSPAAPDVIGTFDPTSLVNGLYELRLAVTTSTSTITTHPLTLIVEGNMKVGAFSLAFEDLKVPVAGIPISLVRTYDSRDTRVGDFGPGWRLAVNNIRVQKNRNLGKDWYQTEFPGFNPPPFYPFYLEPVNERIVTVTMPDGESHRFRAGADVTNSASRPGDPVNVSLSVPSSTGKFRFYPMGDTTSKLEPLDSSNQLAETFYNESYGTQDLTSDDPSVGGSGTVFNPTRFRLTTKDGTKYIVDEKLGLMRLEDLNGNTLVLNRDAQERVTSLVSTQAAPSGPITTTIDIHRDATGRVDYITDLAGATLDYLYDPSGRLESFTNRTDDTTQFKYENPSFPYYLTKIIDPRGVTALRSEFDENGKLFKQIDADGKETIFNRGIDAGGRFEKIKDRLGHETTFYYDDRGNVTTKIDSLNAITSFSYYPDSDRVKFETDHYGNTKSMAYDSRGNVTVQTTGASLTEDPANPTTGYTTRTTYNDRSAPTLITDPAGRVQSFSYDPTTGNLLSNTVGVGGTAPATTTYHYNTDGTLDTITDSLGTVTSHTYNYAFSDQAYPTAVKQVTVTVSQLSALDSQLVLLRTSRTIYDSQENLLATIATRTLPAGGTEDIVTKYVYDAENRLNATIMPDGKVSETRYTSFGQTDKSLLWKSIADYTSQDDSRARVTSYGYDNRGNQTSTTYPDGTSESSHLDLENRRDWSQDRLGHRTYFKYDDVGRLRFTIQPDATPGDLTDNPSTETVYDLTGRVTDTYDELRHRTTVTYFPDGTPDAGRRKESIQVLSTGNLATSYQYDATGAVRFVTDPRGNTTETRYDDQGRPTTVIYPATDEHPSTQSSTKYDILGRRIETVDQEGKTTRYRYDGLGRLFEVRQYLDAATATADANLSLPTTHSSLVATRYSFDELGHQMSQTDARNNTTNYRYDSLGRRTQRILPDNSTETLQYDEWGNLWKRTDFKGYTTTFGYDVLNRLKTKAADPTHPSLVYSQAIARVEYDYNDAGERTAARTFNATSTTPLYTESTPRDERGRLDFKTTAQGTLDYDYFVNGLLKDVVSSNSGGANVGYRYDEANRLAYVDDASSGTTRTTSYSYNANGSLETVLTPNGVMHDYSYDTLNRLRALSVTNSLGTLRSYTYALNPSGHRKKITENTGRTADYLYDGLYRLTSETIAGAIGQNGTIGYTLDKVGNREVRTSSVGSIPSISSTFNNRDWLSGDSFDLNGNTLTSTQPLAIVAQPDVYDFEDRLIIRHKTDGSSINFAYDADGLLRSKTVLDLGLNPVRTTQRLIDTNNLTGYAQVVEEYQITAAGTTATIYTYGSDLISQTSSTGYSLPATHYFGYDGLGSVRTLTDATGTVTDTWDYDAFGNTVARTGTTDNAYLYRGEQYDADLGMYYLRARFYNQATGRFWNQDSYEGSSGDPASLHKYLYANASPLMFSDPSGNSWLMEATTSLFVRGTLMAMSYPRIFAVMGLVASVLIPEEIDQALTAGRIPGYQGISMVRQGELKIIKTLKNKWVSSQLTSKLRGFLSNRAGHAFEDVLFKSVMPGAERGISTGRFIADGRWRGRLIEIKTSVRLDADDLEQLAEFSKYAKNEGIGLTYFFLSSPGKTTVDRIRAAGGSVVSFFD